MTQEVSTHSRAEAAAATTCINAWQGDCFNTQPRGGGCSVGINQKEMVFGFNTQPRGGGCIY